MPLSYERDSTTPRGTVRVRHVPRLPLNFLPDREKEEQQFEPEPHWTLTRFPVRPLHVHTARAPFPHNREMQWCSSRLSRSFMFLAAR
eukprot:1088160-Rhodomonas_salina.1